jgi:hypothetical protein
VQDVVVSSDAVLQLIAALSVGDSQDSERRSVMRSAFNEIAATSADQKQVFLDVLVKLKLLKAKYVEHHELFIKRFSVNKVLLEISNQDLKYTSRINEIISNAQSKALAIPGAFIAISVVMKIDNVVEGIAVITGLLLTTLIVLKSLTVHQNTYTHINGQIENEFERYDNLNEEAEVRRQSMKVKGELLTLVDTSSRGLSYITNILRLTLLLAFIYIFIFHIDYKNDVKEGSTSSESLSGGVLKNSMFGEYSAPYVSKNVKESTDTFKADLGQLSKKRVVVGDNLRVRKMPSHSSEIIEYVHSGKLITVVNEANLEWLEVSIDNRGRTIHGWVSKLFVRDVLL